MLYNSTLKNVPLVGFGQIVIKIARVSDLHHSNIYWYS